MRPNRAHEACAVAAGGRPWSRFQQVLKLAWHRKRGRQSTSKYFGYHVQRYVRVPDGLGTFALQVDHTRNQRNHSANSPCSMHSDKPHRYSAQNDCLQLKRNRKLGAQHSGAIFSPMRCTCGATLPPPPPPPPWCTSHRSPSTWHPQRAPPFCAHTQRAWRAIGAAISASSRFAMTRHFLQSHWRSTGTVRRFLRAAGVSSCFIASYMASHRGTPRRWKDLH